MKTGDQKRVIAADTSFLLSLLGTDSNTGAALKIVGSLTFPITICSLNDLELLNASFMAEFQGFREVGSASLIARGLEEDKKSGRFVSPSFSPSKAIARATELSRRYTLSEGHRTYDVLLVAAALEIKATDFLTFDDRQAKLAKSEGLRVHQDWEAG